MFCGCEPPCDHHDEISGRHRRCCPPPHSLQADQVLPLALTRRNIQTLRKGHISIAKQHLPAFHNHPARSDGTGRDSTNDRRLDELLCRVTRVIHSPLQSGQSRRLADVGRVSGNTSIDDCCGHQTQCVVLESPTIRSDSEQEDRNVGVGGNGELVHPPI
ncbi:hypothetical protein BLNAU_8610 [Blattamonas nauphoetae]|uniref:Uncharacterized protein n=1 Tax=Blattamonas nauphoetae TaxID=2049346 RepID=A0ABQ9XY19_9EUKA|nr:hypothetical protein BLNAU_8610 [Blattamonas nauphoetae]